MIFMVDHIFILSIVHFEWRTRKGKGNEYSSFSLFHPLQFSDSLPFSSPSSLPQSEFRLFSIPFNPFPSPSSISSSVDIHPISICIIIHSVRDRESSQESFASTPISGGSWVSLSLYSLLSPLLPSPPSFPHLTNCPLSSSIIPSYYTWEWARKEGGGGLAPPSLSAYPPSLSLPSLSSVTAQTSITSILYYVQTGIRLR